MSPESATSKSKSYEGFTTVVECQANKELPKHILFKKI